MVVSDFGVLLANKNSDQVLGKMKYVLLVNKLD